MKTAHAVKGTLVGQVGNLGTSRPTQIQTATKANRHARCFSHTAVFTWEPICGLGAEFSLCSASLVGSPQVN